MPHALIGCGSTEPWVINEDRITETDRTWAAGSCEARMVKDPPIVLDDDPDSRQPQDRAPTTTFVPVCRGPASGYRRARTDTTRPAGRRPDAAVAERENPRVMDAEPT